MMRIVFLLLSIVAVSPAEFLRVEVELGGVDCVSCVESLRGRLKRVRGMESVAIDLDTNRVVMSLAEGNRVRLLPLLSRITQGGTKIVETNVTVRGKVSRDGELLTLAPSGLTETYKLETGEVASVESGRIYRVVGVVIDDAIRVRSIGD